MCIKNALEDLEKIDFSLDTNKDYFRERVGKIRGYVNKIKTKHPDDAELLSKAIEKKYLLII